MNLPKTGKIPHGKLRSILQYATNVPRDDGAGRPVTLPSTDPRGRDHRWLISMLHCEQLLTNDVRSNAPNKSRRWKYKTRLYDHNYFGPVPATPGKHADFYTRSEVKNSSEQAGGHSINTRPSYKALSLRRQQKKQQQNKLFPCTM